MSKEQILINNVVPECNNPGVHKSMDYFSKQQCIAFAEWILKTGWEKLFSDENMWLNNELNNNWRQPLTSEQLYNLFLEHQKEKQ